MTTEDIEFMPLKKVQRLMKRAIAEKQEDKDFMIKIASKLVGG